MLCDFRSDTVTLPSRRMKEAMMSAPEQAHLSQVVGATKTYYTWDFLL